MRSGGGHWGRVGMVRNSSLRKTHHQDLPPFTRQLQVSCLWLLNDDWNIEDIYVYVVCLLLSISVSLCLCLSVSLPHYKSKYVFAA